MGNQRGGVGRHAAAGYRQSGEFVADCSSCGCFLCQTATCRSVVKTPLVLVAWKERADVLWGHKPGASLWRDLNTALSDPQGWAAYNHPEWGYVKFGHTDPLKSNSGFMTILLITYGYYNKTADLSASDILSNTDYQKWFLETESSIGQFEYSTGPLMEKMGSKAQCLSALLEAC